MASTTLHPLISVAAVAVTLAAATSIAASAGWLGASARGNDTRTLNAPLAIEANQQRVNAVTTRPEPKPAAKYGTTPVDKPMAKPVTKPVASGATNTAAARPEAPPLVKVQSTNDQDRNLGTVVAVRTVSEPAKPSGIGAVAGGVIGGVLGNQIGNGKGRTVGAVIGAVGGGFAGNEIEKRIRTTTRHEVTLRYSDGSTAVFSRENPWNVSPGDTMRTPAEPAASNPQSRSLPPGGSKAPQSSPDERA